MSKGKKALLGLATCWPLLYLTIVFIFPQTRLFLIAHGWTLRPKVLTLRSLAMMGLFDATVLSAGLLLLYYCLHLSRSKSVPEEERLPWVFLLVLGSVAVMPAYWYLYVWTAVERMPPSALYPPRH